jgi:hypothetical protein
VGGLPVYFDGLTNDQLFFVYYASSWCTKETQAGWDSQVAHDGMYLGATRIITPPCVAVPPAAIVDVFVCLSCLSCCLLLSAVLLLLIFGIVR